MERLSHRFRLIAADLYGHGGTPPWPDHRGMLVDDEVDLLEPVFRMASDRFHLIGHSWGGAIALKAALRYGPRLKSLVLFEPALWSLLIAHEHSSDAARDIQINQYETQRLMDAGDYARAGEYFIDYWIGPGTWQRLTQARRSAFAESMRAASPEWHASFHETTTLAGFAAVDVPCLLLSGTKSTDPARAMTRLLSSVLPQAIIEELKGTGHMGPVTHPELVNSAIERFLLKVSECQPDVSA
jgi:pimeloyl-ACP methyl ester carboxylesterase